MKQLIILLIAVSLFSCNKNVNSSKTTSPYVVFELYKTTCRGKCPSYRLTISSDGSMIYKGISNVDRKGIYSKSLSKTELAVIRTRFDDANFFDFEDQYTSKTTDKATTYVSYTKDDVTKKITDYHGSPESLKSLENLLIETGNRPDWKFVEALPNKKR